MTFPIERVRRKLLDPSGQAVVEAAVCIPAAIVMGLICYNLLIFASACARFDRVALDTVISQGISPPGEEASSSAAAVVQAAIEGAMNASANDSLSISVSEATADISLYSTFTCSLSMRPWPSSFVIAGVAYHAPEMLKHERVFTVDRYRPGIVLKRE